MTHGSGTTIADEATAESPLWAQALRRGVERDLEPVFSSLGEERFALGLETIYEGYLLHYGRPRLFAPADHDNTLLLGDYLYAHGLVRVAAHREVDAVADLAELISLCAQLRAGELEGDGAAWAAAPPCSAAAYSAPPARRSACAATPRRCSRSHARPRARRRSTGRSPRTWYASVRVSARWSRSRSRS